MTDRERYNALRHQHQAWRVRAGGSLEIKGVGVKLNSYTVNPAGQVTRVDYSSGTPVTYTYDTTGSLIRMTDAEGVTTIQYNTANLVERITMPDSRELTYTYDTAGRRTSVVDQSGYRLNYSYSADGLLESVITGSGDMLAA